MGHRKSCWRIDTLLLPVKVHYFIYFGGLACALPFRTVFAKQLGISATALGIIFLAVPFFKILTNPLLGYLVDQFKRFRLTISVLMAIVAATHVAMVLIPELNGSTKQKEFVNSINFSMLYNCSEFHNEEYEHLKLFVVSEYRTKTLDINSSMMCNVNCQSRPLLPAKFVPGNEICNGNIKLTSEVNISVSGCNLSFSLGNDVVMSFKNSSLGMIYTQEELDLPDEQLGTQKCFLNSKNYFNNIKSGALEFFENMTSDSKTVLDYNEISEGNVSKRYINETEQIYFLVNSRNYKIGNASFYESCPCSEWLNCAVENCHDSLEDFQEHDEFTSYQFWLLFWLISISSSCFCAVMFLVDAICYEMLSNNNKGKYGLQRLWGTIGWGLGALGGGYLNELFSQDSANVDYSMSFYFLAILLTIDLIPVAYLKVDEVHYSSQICKDVCLLLSRIDIAINVIMAFVVGVLSGLVWNYQFWFMEEIGASQILLGLSQFVECLLAEVPCFLVSGWIINKIGFINCNSLTFLCFGFRYLFLAVIKDPWMTLPIGLLNGPCFGIFFASITMYGKTEAPPGTEATIQSLLSMAFEGIGAGTGCILGGIGIDYFGARNTFFYSAIASFIFLVINVLLHIFYFRGRKQTPEISEKTLAEREFTTKF